MEHHRPPDHIASARAAGLVYVSDTAPGYSCRRANGRLIVRDSHGRLVRDAKVIERIRRLVLPPAWRDVWVAREPSAHLQATGRDAAGRKQYRYHPGWTSIRDAAKYDRAIAFARALPAIRRRIARDFRHAPLSRPFVLATVVRLLDHTHIRIGNEEYARANGSHGLTTLRDKHVAIHGHRLTFRFRAKSGVLQTVELTDERLARAVARCQDLPGQALFQYVDQDGALRAVSSSDVNAYLREITGDAFTAKDFRTWAGTLEAARALDETDGGTRQSVDRAIVQAVDRVAAQLGNTRAVCRKCYIHPAVIEAFRGGITLTSVAPTSAKRGLTPSEARLLQLLQQESRRAVRRAA